MPDPTKRLVDELRYRIADPGTYLPRLINDAGAPRETVAGWSARAILAGLEDGTLGYVPAGEPETAAPTAEQVQPLPPVDAAAGCDMTRDGHRCARLADHEDGCLFPPAADPEPRR